MNKNEGTDAAAASRTTKKVVKRIAVKKVMKRPVGSSTDSDTTTKQPKPTTYTRRTSKTEARSNPTTDTPNGIGPSTLSLDESTIHTSNAHVSKAGPLNTASTVARRARIPIEDEDECDTMNDIPRINTTKKLSPPSASASPASLKIDDITRTLQTFNRMPYEDESRIIENDIPMEGTSIPSNERKVVSTTPLGISNDDGDEESVYDEMTWYDEETLHESMQSFDEITVREEDDDDVLDHTIPKDSWTKEEDPPTGIIRPVACNQACHKDRPSSAAVVSPSPSTAQSNPKTETTMAPISLSSFRPPSHEEEDPPSLVSKATTSTTNSTTNTLTIEEEKPLDKATELINPFYDPIIKSNHGIGTTVPWDTRETLQEYEKEHGSSQLLTIKISKETQHSRVGMTVACIGGFLFCIKINQNGLLAATDLQVGDIIVSINEFSFRKFPNAKHAYGKSFAVRVFLLICLL